MSDSIEKSKIIQKYLNFVKKKNAYPTRADMLKLGVNRDKIRHYFGSLVDLKDKLKKSNPEAFVKIVDESLFTPKAFKKLREEAGKYQRYFVTTAVTGCIVHKGFLQSIDTYCKRNNALLLVLPCSDPASGTGWTLDSILADRQIVFKDLALNDKIYISSIELSAKHMDPITGLGRIGQRNGSFIYASPKQRLKMVSTSNTKLPNAIMTTGALTSPDYDTNKYMSKRTAYIAENDHVMGGIIVEIADDHMFHFRQIQADNKGHFPDLGIFYKGHKVEELLPDSLVLGDWHSGETDPVARGCYIDNKDSVLNTVKPSRIILHDGFNGKSISHHELKDKVTRARHASSNKLSLQEELEQFVKDLNDLSSKVEEVVIVKSNHDEFLDRYLKDGRYVDEPQNHLIGLKLAAAMVEGKDPLRFASEWIGLKNPERITWLQRDEDFKVANIELGAHGDKGSNGSRGSLTAMENAYGNSVSGHSHTPEILRGAWQVGTLSYLKLNYNVGPSSWMHSSCLVYPNGARQLINVIDGNWRLAD